MQAALAPLLAGGAAAGGTAAAGGLAGSLALGAQALGPIFGAFSSMQQASSMRQQEKINAEIGRIRADQTDTVARQGLEDEISSFRSAFSANDAGSSVATLGILNEVRKVRERDRRINLGNARQQQYSASARARSYRPGIALGRGLARAAPSIFELYGSLR